MGRPPKVAPEAQALTARLAELGVERAPHAVERLLAAGRMALHAIGATDISIEVECAWGLDFCLVDGGDVITVDAFLIQQAPENEEPFL